MLLKPQTLDKPIWYVRGFVQLIRWLDFGRDEVVIGRVILIQLEPNGIPLQKYAEDCWGPSSKDQLFWCCFDWWNPVNMFLEWIVRRFGPLRCRRGCNSSFLAPKDKDTASCTCSFDGTSWTRASRSKLWPTMQAGLDLSRRCSVLNKGWTQQVVANLIVFFH